jgi:uncharacterized protein YndB with AHSA1/START domain
MEPNPTEIANKIVTYDILINAPASRVWEVLTTAEFMKQWVSDVENEVISDFVVGSPIVIRAHMDKYTHENKGVILEFEPEKVFRYNYWTKISRLPDTPENYSEITFKLEPVGGQTMLTVTQTNFVAKASFEHADFYWRATVRIIKHLAESL